MVKRRIVIVGPPKSPFRIESEAAEILGLSLRSLMNNRYAGKGHPYRKHGGRVVYHIDDLKIHRAARREKGLAVPPWPEHLK